jgi:hypothetical protein
LSGRDGSVTPSRVVQAARVGLGSGGVSEMDWEDLVRGTAAAVLDGAEPPAVCSCGRDDDVDA